MRKILIVVLILIIIIGTYYVFIREDENNISNIDTSDWKEYNKRTGRPIPIPPYNFTFKYPSDFTYGVDIGSIVLRPIDSMRVFDDDPSPRVTISATLDTNNLGSLENVIAESLKGVGTLSGHTIDVDGYEAKEITYIDTNRKDKVWILTTYPDTPAWDYGDGRKSFTGRYTIVYITSTLQYDQSIPQGTAEEIISSIKMQK